MRSRGRASANWPRAASSSTCCATISASSCDGVGRGDDARRDAEAERVERRPGRGRRRAARRSCRAPPGRGRSSPRSASGSAGRRGSGRGRRGCRARSRSRRCEPGKSALTPTTAMAGRWLVGGGSLDVMQRLASGTRCVRSAQASGRGAKSKAAAGPATPQAAELLGAGHDGGALEQVARDLDDGALRGLARGTSRAPRR